MGKITEKQCLAMDGHCWIPGVSFKHSASDAEVDLKICKHCNKVLKVGGN